MSLEKNQENLSVFDKTYPFYGGYLHTKLFSIIIKYNICDIIEKYENGIDYKEISKQCQINQETLYRVLRYFVPFKLFNEKEEGTFSKTELSSLFTTISHKNMAKRYSNEFNYKLCENIEDSVKENTNYGPRGMGCETYWETFDKYPEHCTIYMESMKAFSQMAIENILMNIDFSPYKSIVDIGGSHGLLIKEILNNYKSNLELGINFDLKCVLDKVELSDTEKSDKRLSFVAGSFFDSVPMSADCYILKNILHDWDDEHVCKILSTIIKSMKKDSKIIIIDFIIDSSNYNKQSLFTDIIMLHSYNGRERTINQWDSIFNSCNLKRDKTINSVNAGCQILSLK